MLAALLSSASLQEEKQGLQKDALSDGSSTKSALYQDERETIPINKFWIKKKKKNVPDQEFLPLGHRHVSYMGKSGPFHP